MRIALIGQSAFGAAVYQELKRLGHEIVGVFTIPDDARGRPDPLAKAALADNHPQLHRIVRWQALKKDGGKELPEVMEKYNHVKADLNVLAYVSQFIPMSVINTPKHGSIVYHPSLLPRHRGASAINWTLMEGDERAGFTIFFADDGLDTGPILLMRSCSVDDNDTVGTIYNRFLYPEGVKAMGEAVNMIATGSYPKITQPIEGATYDAMWQKHDVAEIKWEKHTTARSLHNFIRGCDPTPLAWCHIDNQRISLCNSTLLIPEWVDVKDGTSLLIKGSFQHHAILIDDVGLIITCPDGEHVLIKQIGMDEKGGKMIQAHQWKHQNGHSEELKLSAEEEQYEKIIRRTWCDILSVSEISDDTDFFAAGAASMDVVRLLATVKQSCGGVELENEAVYMNTVFSDFVRCVILTLRGANTPQSVPFKSCDIRVNDMDIKIPTQMFINGKFVDSESGKTQPTINPSTEQIICHIPAATTLDVSRAIRAARAAFDMNSPWRQMNARDRGRMMFKLADLMELYKEELATIESMDSGAVYTLALKTHVGMSIETFRYFAGWCDKIQGSTIPINHARPNRNLCITKRDPVGVVGLVVPWNYPLMMLSWKMAAALAAGNTVIIKPAQVTPLTALKFAQLASLAGFPPGVINVVTGSGTIVGHALASDPHVRKLGFTGSTEIGKVIMSTSSANVKKISLELGGKSPLIIFDDCDIKKAVRQAMGAVFFNKGENCIAAGRIFVESSIHDQFVQQVIEETSKMVIGDPLDRSVSHGPQNHKAHYDKLLQYVERGKAEGAKLVYGGVPYRSDKVKEGFFFTPAIFTHVTDKMWIASEESFGPVMIITKFSGGIDGVLRSANATEYGLCAGVFTNDMSKALRVSELLYAGTVFINTYNKTDVAAPFGGIKQSGFGKDLGQEALNEYLHTRTITMEY